ncbi:hypothetical protein [Anaerolinea thermophila]|uniref:Uncharacterized protein n=1 Tax=Anaerolinea thermophila (strain DSM 14523 / JCM 11388 / NBRC 100420 / UNI-1) TaxID=926569 RepID=E8MYS6_ANATU|nr:hypothetical protein [Anaerolinea thermophila]BAJ64412.1 hypothetical protein ANT_23860 [Anaerolinea thermophila UNI-1]
MRPGDLPVPSAYAVVKVLPLAGNHPGGLAPPYALCGVEFSLGQGWVALPVLLARLKWDFGR